jgi:hypothetical protein
MHRGRTIEYQVEHPRWRVWQADECWLECNVAALYGPQYRASLSAAPTSAFLADGSQIAVRQGRAISSVGGADS